MASIPTEATIKKAQAKTQSDIDEKMKSQEKLGKSFNADSRVGVIPEKVWQKHNGRVHVAVETVK